jgi:CHAT domain-containing protein
LNACETGRNLVRHGDELYGLLRALLYTGAPSVLLTLWKVEDLSARLFMQTFYEEVAQHSDPRHLRFSESLASTIRRFRALDAGTVRRILCEDGWPDEQVEAMLLRIPRTPSANAGQALPDDARLFDHPYFWAPFVLVGERWVMDSAA